MSQLKELQKEARILARVYRVPTPQLIVKKELPLEGLFAPSIPTKIFLKKPKRKRMRHEFGHFHRYWSTSTPSQSLLESKHRGEEYAERFVKIARGEKVLGRIKRHSPREYKRIKREAKKIYQPPSEVEKYFKKLAKIESL